VYSIQIGRKYLTRKKQSSGTSTRQSEAQNVTQDLIIAFTRYAVTDSTWLILVLGQQTCLATVDVQ